MKDLKTIVDRFVTEGITDSITPLGDGLINDTFLVRTRGEAPDYVLQRINHNIFRDVEGLQSNIEAVTGHIRSRLEADGVTDLDRRVLRFVHNRDNGKTYIIDDDGSYWRMSVFISDAITRSDITPESAWFAGKAFGEFQSQLTDIPVTLVETIPDFHNMEFRLRQLDEAVAADPAGRLAEVADIVADLRRRAERMTAAERLYREGKLTKRVCHCDTKVNNMLFDSDGRVLCVIDLDTVMPGFIFSDYGDFLRTGACTSPEDEPDLSRVHFDMDIFRSFTRGYFESAGKFLTPLEIEMLPWGAELFPYMQAVRFLTDYINGDTYYKIQYPDHNLVRTRAQVRLLEDIEAHEKDMTDTVAGLVTELQK